MDRGLSYLLSSKIFLVEATIEEGDTQKKIFFKIAALQNIKLIVCSKSLKNTSEKV